MTPVERRGRRGALNWREFSRGKRYLGVQRLERSWKGAKTQRKEPNSSDRALFAFLPNEVFVTYACTCAARESNEISVISLLLTVRYS